MSQDDMDEMDEKRFQLMVGTLAKIDEQYATFNEVFKQTAEQQASYFAVQADLAATQKELLAAQLAIFKHDNGL